ncbi:MAG: hypothetical protein LH605_02550, partial [Microbacteriaceae bacterium]|nr:hypothetical protein [Microbacteriaceae bacterium]
MGSTAISQNPAARDLSLRLHGCSVPGVPKLIRYDTNKACKGPSGAPIPGGFGWLDRGGQPCETTVDLLNSRVQSEPGNSYPGSCESTMAALDDDPNGTTIIVPIYDGADSATGPAKWFNLYGLAAFHIMGW